MAEEQTPTVDAGDEPQGAPLLVNAQYTKDLSFEIPSAPQIFAEMENNPPKMNINIEVNARPLGENVFEVSLSTTTNCQIGEKTGFILELVYAGVFTLNIPKEHQQAVLLIECPRLLFPFARNIIADITRDGGFPPVMLGQVDFVGMYQRRIQSVQQSAET